MKKLDLAKVDLGVLAEALEDHSDETSWWIDPRSGELVPWVEFASEDEERPSERGFRRIWPIESRESYGDMEDFIERVRDRRAQELLRRAIAGRGAFRRFKDTLLEFPDLRAAWFKFHDERMARRAIEWLRDEGFIDEELAEREVAAHPDPDLPEIRIPFDPDEIARRVTRDLRQLYGDRLREVRIFGSWARGDATPESDLDLLVVLDPMESSWAEHDRMEDVLWQHTKRSGVLISALPVSVADFKTAAKPVLIRARAEGRVVG